MYRKCQTTAPKLIYRSIDSTHARLHSRTPSQTGKQLRTYSGGAGDGAYAVCLSRGILFAGFHDHSV